MSLVKWFRKNNKKVMAIMVIVILFGFIGGGTLLDQLSRRATGLHKTIAYFGDNRKITNYDLFVQAPRELELLRMLSADDLLRSIAVPVFGTPDLRAILLGELLFADQSISPAIINHIKQITRTNEYRISDKQINDIYRRSKQSEIYWMLLKNEAQLAGVMISNKQSRNQLASAIQQMPQLSGVTYSQLIGSIVNPPPRSNRQGIPEEQILSTFGKLLAILEYADITCSSEDITTAQIRHKVSWENETIDAEFVRFSSEVFTETQPEPNQEEISAHFEKYKKYFAGDISEENPYGFGYKLADRVQLEYIAVKLDDVSNIVSAPTEEEVVTYWEGRRVQFTEQVPSDPNDPNSPLTKRIKKYAEVKDIIAKDLLQNKINSKAEEILQQAKTLTDVDLEGSDTELENLSSEQLGQMVGDYETAIEQLSKKYGIKIYSGQTGLLSSAEMRMDEQLGRLYIRGYGSRNVVELTQVVFAIDEIGIAELGPFDMLKPKMYENIGPTRDMRAQIAGYSGINMLIVRVIKAEKASEPESINQTFSTRTLRFETSGEDANEDVYSVREKVVEDLKKLASMNTAKSRAEGFIEQVKKDGWENTIEKFNELYKQQDKQDESDPNVSSDPNVIKDPEVPFKLQNLTDLRRISRDTMGTLAVQSAGDAAEQFLVNTYKKESRLRDRLYSLVPQDSNSVETLPLIMEFKPDMSYYCLKSILVKRFEQDMYEKIKALRAYKEDHIRSQSLAAVHFNPENILKRMNFREVKQQGQVVDTKSPAASTRREQESL